MHLVIILSLKILGRYNHIETGVTEIKDMLCNNFSSPEDAFQFFINHGSNRSGINYECFCQVISDLIPGRFSKEELSKIWTIISGNAIVLRRPEFLQMFDESEFIGNLSVSNFSKT